MQNIQVTEHTNTKPLLESNKQPMVCDSQLAGTQNGRAKMSRGELLGVGMLRESREGIPDPTQDYKSTCICSDIWRRHPEFVIAEGGVTTAYIYGRFFYSRF